MRHLSDLALDAVRLERATPEEQAHFDGCAVCRDNMVFLKTDAEAFANRFPPRVLAAQTLQVIERAEGDPVPWGAAKNLLVGVAVLGATLGFVVMMPKVEPPAVADRVKGVAQVGLKVRVKRDGVVSEGQSGQGFQAGDALMIGMNPGRHAHVKLLYRDSSGNEEVWFEGTAPTGRWTWTDQSFVLDDATGRERLTAVYGDERVVFEVRKE